MKKGRGTFPFFIFFPPNWCVIFLLKKSALKGEEIDMLREEEIINRLKEAAKDDKISCALAQKIALDNRVPMKQVGDLLNKLKIKIVQCQLGCF